MRKLFRGTLLFAGVGIVTSVLILLLLDLTVMPSIVQVGKVRVPDLRQLPIDKGARRLANRGLRLAIRDSLFQEVLPAGHIVDQTPITGQRIKQGRRVFVDISRGPRLNPVPNLVQKSLRQAKLLLAGARLRLGSVRYVSSRSLARNAIVDQVPRAGVALKRNAAVDVEISSGPPNTPKKVPKVGDLLVDVVIDTLDKYEMRLGRIDERVDNRRPAGVILSQRPAAGDHTPRLTRVDVVITAHEIARVDTLAPPEEP